MRAPVAADFWDDASKVEVVLALGLTPPAGILVLLTEPLPVTGVPESPDGAETMERGLAALGLVSLVLRPKPSAAPIPGRGAAAVTRAPAPPIIVKGLAMAVVADTVVVPLVALTMPVGALGDRGRVAALASDDAPLAGEDGDTEVAGCLMTGCPMVAPKDLLEPARLDGALAEYGCTSTRLLLL